MRNCISLLIVYFLMLFGCQTIKAQHVINLPNIDLIAYNNDAEFIMFEEVGYNSYSYTEINFEETTDDFLRTLLEKETDGLYTFEEIKEDFAHVIFVNEIQATNTAIWQQYDWFLHTEDTAEKEITVLRFLENGLAFYQELLFQETSNKVHVTETDKYKWQVEDTVWFEIVVLNFGNGKEMILLNEEDAIVFLGIPLQNQIVLVSNEIEVLSVNSLEKDSYPIDEYEALTYFEPDYMYKIVKDEAQKYRLYDNFKNDLLQSSFDTIVNNKFFVVGQKGTQYSIYNSVLTPFEIPNIRKVYLQEMLLEVLISDAAFYLDIFGNQFQSLSQKIYDVCGTVAAVKHELIKDNTKKYPYTVKVTHTNTGYQADTEETYTFTNHKKKQVLSFINDTTVDYSDENDEFIGAISGFPNFIKVFNGKKYGLRSYDIIHHNKTLQTTITDENSRKRRVYNELFVKTIKELPVKYDSIIVNQDNMIVFYKNTKSGIFPHHKKPKYQSLERVTASFYKIVQNRKTGWLDIKTMEVFFN